MKRVPIGHRTIRSQIAFAFLLAVAAATATHAAEFIPLGNLPGGQSMSAEAISADGRVVVGLTSPSPGVIEAARWTREQGMVSIGGFPVDPSQNRVAIATAVNADGSVIAGYSNMGANPFAVGFRWTAATGFESIAGPGHNNPLPYAISADGSTIVGDSNSQPFRWTAQTGVVSLGRLVTTVPGQERATAVSADGSVVVGRSLAQVSPGVFSFHAFRWTAATGLVDLDPQTQFAVANAITPDGQTIIGLSSQTGAFRWTVASGFVSLDPASAAGTDPLAISADANTITGTRVFTAGQEAEPFIWDQTHGFRRLADILTSQGIDLTGWQLQQVKGLSADGSTVIGVGQHNGQSESFIANIIPEPITGTTIAAITPLLLIRRRHPRPLAA